MDTLSVALYFFAASISLFCFFLLLLFRRQIQLFPGFLSAYIAVLAIKMSLTLAMHSSLVPATLIWLYLLCVLSFCNVPLMLRYFKRQNDQLTDSLSTSDFLHLGIVILACLLCSPLLIAQTEGLWQWIDRNSSWFWTTYYASLTLAVLLYVLQNTIFLRVSLPLVTSAGWRSMFSFGRLLPRTAVLNVLVISTVFQVAINILRAVHCRLEGVPSLSSLGLSMVDILLSVGLIVTLILLMLKETLLESRPDQTGNAERMVNKYQRSVLSQADSQRIRKKVLAALEDKSLIFDSSLNLRSFSQALHEKPHYVSQVINQYLDNNFFDLINDTRVRFSLALLRDKPEWTIVDIAMQVGFNAKSTYYKAFGKSQGCSPARYRNNLKQ